MKKSFILIILAAFCFASLPVIGYAQNEGSGVKIIKTPEQDKEILKKSKPSVPKTPQVPNFILKDKSNKFMMALGGYIQPIVGWDLGNDISNICFIPALIPVPAVKGQKSDFFINPLFSTFDLQLVGMPGTKDEVTAYANVRFVGPSRTLQLQELYVTYKGFKTGLSTSLYTDAGSLPTTIDPQGPNGALYTYTYQVAYNSKSYDGFSFALSMELPNFDNYKGIYKGKDYPEFENDNLYGNASQSCPDFVGFMQYQGKGLNNRVRVSGIVRNFRYKDILANDVNNVFGWGVELSGTLQPCKPLTIFYQGSYGKGTGAYYQDLSGLPCSFIPKETPGKMKASPMMGWMAALSYTFSPKVTAGAIFSENRIWNSGAYYPNYKYGLYGEASIFYNITPYLQWGIEYLHGRLNTFDNGHASDNRIQTAIMFSL